MIVRVRLFVCLIAAALAIRAGTATAQTIRSPYRHIEQGQALGAFGGYILTDRGELDLGPESGPVAGLRYSIRLGGPFTAEAGASYFPTTREVFDTTASGQPLRRIGEADLTLVLLDAALRFNVTGPRTWYDLQPYLIAGGGAAIEVSGDDEAESGLASDVRFDFGTRFAGQVGAGVEWFALRRLALRADARDVFWRLKTPPVFGRPELELEVPEDEWVQNFVLSLGVAYHF